MTDETLTKLRSDFAEHPVTAAEPVPEEEIDALEQAVGFKLPDDYRQFVREFGGGIVGAFSVYGLRAADAMGDDEASALEVTERFRNDGWRGVEKWLVVSSDHSGNPVGLDEQGVVWISDHDAGSIEKLADTFEGYLRRACLGLES